MKTHKIEMNGIELRVLHSLLGSVNGDPEHTARKYTESLLQKINGVIGEQRYMGELFTHKGILATDHNLRELEQSEIDFVIVNGVKYVKESK